MEDSVRGSASPMKRTNTMLVANHEHRESIDNVELSTSGIQRFLSKFLHTTFKDDQLERMYGDYQQRIKRDFLKVFLFMSLCFDVNVILLSSLEYSEEHIACLIIACVHGFISILMGILILCKKLPEYGYKILPGVLWVLFCVVFYAFTVLSRSAQTEYGVLVWQCILIYTTFMTLPLSLVLCFVLSVVSCAVQLVVLMLVPVLRDYDHIFDMGNMVSDECHCH